MSVVIGQSLRSRELLSSPAEERYVGRSPQQLDRSPLGCIEIGLVNNMPDPAVRATERQFIELLGAAAETLPVRLRFYRLPEIQRDGVIKQHIRRSYTDIEALDDDTLDALIVTGCEPRTASLPDEVYWRRLTQVIDWAAAKTISTVWSCLAAHAAVLHLDGIERRPLADKRHGIFACHPIADDPLLSGAPSPLMVVHSRWNDLASEDLTRHGYRILTRSPSAGVDMFVKRQQRSQFVFLQGHPEYAPESLADEYRRDVGRFLRGEASRYPKLPADYFDPPTEAVLIEFANRAATERDPDLFSEFPDRLALRPGPMHTRLASARTVYRNWLNYLADQKGQKADRRI